MNNTIRINDVITNENDLELIYSFKNFPIFMSVVDDIKKDNDLLFDLSWHISKKSGCIQLKYIPDLEKIYLTSHGSGTIGTIWEKHHLEFSEFITKFIFNKANILEIGGGHGYLSNKLLDINKTIHCTLIDPNPTAITMSSLKIEKGFFPTSSNEKFDLIVHSHLFEHMLNPNEFCNQIFNKLSDNGFLVFSVPNLQAMLKKNYTNVLNFEHTFLLNENNINYLLSRNNFKIIEKKYYLEDHSIMYCVKKMSSVDHKFVNDYDQNLKLILNSINFYKRMVINQNKKLIQSKYENVYLFGGHVMSQFLLAYGLNENLINGIIDNDKKKWNKRLYGSNLFVFDPKILANMTSVAVILRAGAFQKEIKTSLEKINHNIIFIED